MSFLVTDVRHLLDAEGSLASTPAPAVELARFLGAIVAWVSIGGGEDTNVSCRCRPARQRCLGDIFARLDTRTGSIEWTCPACGDGGVISGWQGTSWDRRNGKQFWRGVHRSTRQLEDAIRRYLSLANVDPKPFVWAKTADEILDSLARFRMRTSGSGH